MTRLLRHSISLLSVVLFLAAMPLNGVWAAGNDDSRFDYFFYEAVNQGRQSHYAEAFDLLQYCLELDSTSAAAKYELAQYYILLGDRDKPGKLLREAVDAVPGNYWYWQLLGDYYAHIHKYADAVKVYEEMASRFPARTDILLGLMSLYDEAGEYRKGLSILDRIELIEGESLQLDVQRFQFFLELNEIDSAYAVIKPNIQWFIQTFSERVTNITELNFMSALCRKAVVDFPDNLVLHYWNAISYSRAGNFDEALEALDAGIAQITESSGKIDAAHLYQLQGDICYTQKNMPAVFAAYSKAVELDPSDNMTANNYAYFLSLDKRELDKAEELSRRTITAEPLNATYLDTYAWILFNQGRYKDALPYIEKAVQCQDEPSPDIMEHCGDIYFMNGNEEEALHYWQEALLLHSESPTLKQKISQRKYIGNEQ